MSPRGLFWVIGGGHMSTYMVDAAHRLGLRVLISDQDVACSARQTADEFALLDIYNIEAHVQEARRRMQSQTICGVACCGTDCAPTVAAVAQVLHVPGIPPDVAYTTHNKLLTRTAISQHTNQLAPYIRLPALAWTVLSVEHHVDTAWQATRRFWDACQAPFVVLKPLEGRASRGVTCIRQPIDFPGAWLRMLTANDGEYAVLEEGVEGTEHSAEVIFNAQGIPCYFNICDRIFQPPGLVPLEIGHTNPSSLPYHAVRDAYSLLLALADVAGVKWGPFKGDLLRDSNGRWAILECAARLSGGFDSQVTVPLSWKRHPVELVVQLAARLDNPTPYFPRMLQDWTFGPPCYAACVGLFPRPGVLQQVPTPAEIAAVWSMAHVEEVIITSKPGTRYGSQIEHCAERIAFVFANARTSQLAWRAALAGAQQLQRHFVFTPEVIDA